MRPSNPEVVGLLCLQRESARVAISGDWRGPEQRYKITKTVPLKAVPKRGGSRERKRKRSERSEERKEEEVRG